MSRVTDAQQHWLAALRAPIAGRVLRSVAEQSSDLSALASLSVSQRQALGLSEEAIQACLHPDPEQLGKDSEWLADPLNHL